MTVLLTPISLMVMLPKIKCEDKELHMLMIKCGKERSQRMGGEERPAATGTGWRVGAEQALLEKQTSIHPALPVTTSWASLGGGRGTCVVYSLGE